MCASDVAGVILVIGGDGFVGWPLALRLATLGAQVIILDNLSRRRIDLELGTESLVPIFPLGERIQTWNQLRPDLIAISSIHIDVATEYDRLVAIFRQTTPTAVVHLAEQRSAPYSMRSSACSRFTLSNNLNSTHNILQCIIATNRSIHLIHLGTMGVYGYGSIPNMPIPEGYITVKMQDVQHVDQAVEILHPANPGSVYHLTKTQDALMFQFLAHNYDLRITDLHQGIVWGTSTTETDLDAKLANRFDYDGDFGTVLNRFIVQATGNIPLTVNGTGEQTRAFIHLSNSMDCIVLAITNPPTTKKVSIFNQVTETWRVIDIANDVMSVANQCAGSAVCILKRINPRKELAANELQVVHNRFDLLGLVPIYLDSTQLQQMLARARKFADRIKVQTIESIPTW